MEGRVHAGHHAVAAFGSGLQQPGEHLQALMLILMAAAGGVPEIEVPEGVDQRAHPHGGQIIGQTLGLPFVAGEHQGAAAGTGAQGAEEGRFMDGGEPRDGSGEPAGVDGLFQLLHFGEGRQGPGEEFHHWKALLSIGICVG